MRNFTCRVQCSVAYKHSYAVFFSLTRSGFHKACLRVEAYAVQDEVAELFLIDTTLNVLNIFPIENDRN